MAVNTPIGKFKVTFLRLLPFAPVKVSIKGLASTLPFLAFSFFSLSAFFAWFLVKGIAESCIFSYLSSLAILARWRTVGTAIFFLPDKYWPVNDSGFLAMSFAVPSAMILPPCTPAPTPTSMIWSARRMASSSCSTTITVLPKSRKRVNVCSSRSLSRWCKPIDGSSSTYITPIKPAPIWLARRIRWASPPDRVSAERARVR